MTYGLNLNARLSRWILSFCKLENKIISIERIYQYSQIPSEAPPVIEDSHPPCTWPENGTIEMVDLKVCCLQFNFMISLHVLVINVRDKFFDVPILCYGDRFCYAYA